MTEAAFRTKRRQNFLTENFFKLNVNRLEVLTKASIEAVEAWDRRSEPPGQDSIFQDRLNLLRLHYTAGAPIETLRPLYTDAIRWLEQANEAYRVYVKFLASEGDALREDGTPLYFEDLFHFQLVMDVVSLGVLLGDGDALRKIAGWVERYRGTDMLFEHLIAPAVNDKRDNTDFFHTEPYDPLIDAIYTAETPQDASAFVKKYLDGWYKSFEGVPWHNGHTIVTDQYMAYEGYWAFEAAAACVIYGIDDTEFRDHFVYPKDLADWARLNGSLERVRATTSGASGASESGRCEAGQPCPRAGFWFTPAQAHSRRYFKAGEVMPSVGGDYGATLWQWDQHQDPPKL